MKRCNEESLGRQIYIVSQEMRNFAERVLKPYALTLEQFHLLKNMSLDAGMTQRQICNLTSKTPANMSRMLDRMESKSLVARRENPVDRRASLVDEVVGKIESFSACSAMTGSARSRRRFPAWLKKLRWTKVTELRRVRHSCIGTPIFWTCKLP